MKKQEIIINEELAGLRIDSVAAKIFPEFSRSQWQKNGEFKEKSGKRAAVKKTKVQLNEVWEVRIKQPSLKKLDVAAILFGESQFVKCKKGAKKIPPPIPTIPEIKPIIPP